MFMPDIPPILALNAIPTPHLWLFAPIAISPAHLVPCLEKESKMSKPNEN